jgi:hypothetical protein
VLDDFSVVVQSKDIDSRPLAIIRPVLETVEDDEMVFGQHAAELHALAGILAGHAFEVLDERLLPVGDDRIVLRICGADVAPDRFRRL